MLANNKDLQVSLSILSSDLGDLNSEVEMMTEAGVDRIHVDVMDGHFVPVLSFGPPLVRNLKTYLPIEVHLMVENPRKYIRPFHEAIIENRELNNDVILAHIEIVSDLSRFIEEAKELGFKAGVVLSPETEVEKIEKYLSELDQVLVMSVDPGYSGQKFMPKVLDKVKRLRELSPGIDIEMDGGLNAETCGLAREAGANVLVSASFLFGAEDKKKAINLLKGIS